VCDKRLARHLGEVIANYVGDGASLGLDVRYSYDGEMLLGTGSALRKALPLLGPEFLVIYGDSYLDIPFAPVVARFHASGLDGLMTVFAISGASDASNVAYDNHRILYYCKKENQQGMRHIDYGLGMIRANALKSYPADQSFDLAEVYSDLARSGNLAGFEIHTRFYEIGSSAGLADADAYLASKSADLLIPVVRRD
jgi:NDP-sugar pyrophosphorylase family protein